MQETTSSLRAYFGLVALVILFPVVELVFTSNYQWIEWTVYPSKSFLATADLVYSCFVALLFFYFAVDLPRFLKQANVRYLKISIVVVAACEIFFAIARVYNTFSQDVFLSTCAVVACSLILSWYLYTNVSRLSHDVGVVSGI